MNKSTSFFKPKDAERIIQSVPAELKNTPQWVAFRIEPNPKGGRPNKVPINPKTGNNAKTNDPKTWSSLEEAIEFSLKAKLHGIGFVFSENDLFFGLDIDSCLYGASFNNRSMELIHAFKTYTEISPSGQGIHIIGKCKPFKHGMRNNELELYEIGRFFTITGKVMIGYEKITDCQVDIEELTLIQR